MRTLPVLFLALLPQAQAPTEEGRRHVEEVTASKWEYRLVHGGTMDGENCRSPIGGGFGIWTQSFESNREVRLENIGETDLVDPWLSNGRNDFRSTKEIVSGAAKVGMSERERALAIWRLETTHRFHAGAGDPAEMHDPVKVFNVYGYTTCGDDAVCLAGLWHAAGFPVSPGRLLGHRTSQVYYEGRWHLMDGDLGPVYLLRDNETVASEQDLVRDHDLVKRSHPFGILDPDRRADREEHAALFASEGEASADRAIVEVVRESTMNMVLRPGEAIVWRWGHGEPLRYHGLEDIRLWGPRSAGGCTWGASAADRICTGRWEYRPDFSRDSWRRGAVSSDGVVVDRGALVSGSVVWRVKSPYVFVGGRLEATGEGVRFSISWDGSAWQPVGGDLDPHFPPRGPARYEYRLKCEIPPGARLERLAILNDVQMAPLALPGMTLGENRFVYTDRSPGARRVRITHQWIERSTPRPPAAPPEPVFPVEGGSTERTQFAFEWRAPEGPEAADYHFELSDRADFAWPLSSNFEKLIGNTSDRGRTRYRLPVPGLLTPGRTYHWHVRARNEEGVWGPWSRTWRFTAGGPDVPRDVRLESAGEGRGWALHWSEPIGRKPARYLVYGSDEKGFTASDEPYELAVGRSTEVPSRMPGNFVAETERPELTVLGFGADRSVANKAYFRVVAVDASGVRSGPSDYAAAPRPFLVGDPRPAAKVGEVFRGSVTSTRSLGDLRLQWVDGNAAASFWDVERPRFALRRAPSWLRLDERTGEFGGVPDVAGACLVEIEATLERSIRRLEGGGPRPWNLGWGKDKTAGIATERSGEATERFTIIVEK